MGNVTRKIYLITYLDEDGEEEVMEVPAYSPEQATFLAGEDILSCEEVVKKEAGAGGV